MTPPPLVLLASYGGDWAAYEGALYDIFWAEIAHGGLRFRGLPVHCRRVPEANGKWASFWHLVQEGRVEEDRTPDLRRCERIRWIPYLINQTGDDPEVTWWENQRGNERSTLLWYNEEYLVIIAQRDGYWLLKTAFCTDRSHRVETLRKEREAYWKARKG